MGARIHAGVPWRLAEGPNGVRAPAPLLGQHTHDVWGRLVGLSDEDIALGRETGLFA